jgi:acyl-CoA dehydrogenase
MDFALSPEQELFRDTVRNWVDREIPKSLAHKLEAADEWPFEIWDKMTAAGFHAIGLPEEYGGQGGDVMTQVIFIREVSRSLGGLTWLWGVCCFCAKSINLFAQPEVKQDLVPKLAAGQARVAISVTEPGGGTDVLGAMQTKAERVDGGWRINGQKIWSTSAHVSNYLLLLARTKTDVAKSSHGLTVFLVPNPSQGLTTREIPKLGMRSLGSCEVFLDDVLVPDQNVVGEVDRGWYHLLATLNNERILVSAMCTGIMDGVLEDGLAYVQQREAFGRPIGQFQVLQHLLADIAIWRQQAELMTYFAAWKQQSGQPCGVEATMAKVVSSEGAIQSADHGITLLGGMGYAMETSMQRYWRDARGYGFGPVTNQMARNIIAESMGLPRSF